MKVVEGKEDRFGKHPIIFKSFNLKQIHQWLFNNYYGYKFAILIDEAIDEYQEIDEVYVYFLDEIAEEVADYCGAELIDRRCKKRAKYEEPKVDWSKVPIDTPILVWDDPDNLIDIDNIDDIKK